MLKGNITDYLFLDIETVPEYASYSEVPGNIKELWDKKSAYQRKQDETAEEFYPKAGIWAEFGRIICISCGFVDANRILRIKTFFDEDEKELLLNFSAMLSRFFQSRTYPRLCGHNGKEFDFPYIARRMLINSLILPSALDVSKLKPWEVPFEDTLEMWKFGDHKHYCSLELLATIFGIPTPKDDIDGSMVAKIYYEENDINRIVKYCEKDVITLVQLFLKLTQQQPFNDIVFVDK